MDIDSQSIDLKLRELSRRFERSWSPDRPPEFEACLLQVPVELRQPLLRELIARDLHLLADSGFSANPNRYIHLTPSDQELAHSILEQLHDATCSQSLGVVLTDDADDAAATPDESQSTVVEIVGGPGAGEWMDPLHARERIGPYRLKRPLGRGGFGVVYEAIHDVDARRVALKVLPESLSGSLTRHAAERIHKLRREFRAVALLNHPNLVGMQSLENDGGQWFLTMELVDGVSFLEYVAPDGQCDLERLLRCLPQLASGVAKLHQTGIVHRDLKPSNIMVTHGGELKILDFGLMVEFGKQMLARRKGERVRFSGTLKYAAPEQFQGIHTPASDWYSVGVMLYQAVSGRLPFSGSIAEMIERKRFGSAPLLGNFPDNLPELGLLIDQLLQRDHEVRPRWYEIKASVSAMTRSSEGEAGSFLESDQPLGRRIEFFGRQTQLAQLHENLESMLQSRSPRIVMVTGRSGEGKSRLIRHFTSQPVVMQRATVISGRCYERDSIPFRALDALVEGLVATIESLPEENRVRIIKASRIENLSRVFPGFFPLTARDESGDGPLTTLRGVSEQQIGELFSRLLQELTRTHPLLICLDDLQWADADSARVLRRVIQFEFPQRIMFIGSYRSELADQSEFMIEWNAPQHGEESIGHQEIAVAPLSPTEVGQLVVNHLDIPPREAATIATQVHAVTSGNIYFLEQIFQTPDVAQLDGQSISMIDVIRRKMRLIHEDAAHILELIAVANRAIDVALIRPVVSRESRDSIRALKIECLIQETGGASERRLDMYHDKVREAVLESMSPTTRCQRHLELATAIATHMGCSVDDLFDQNRYSDSHLTPRQTHLVYDLAWHFFKAGDRRALKCLVVAGEVALQSYAASDAIRLLQRAAAILGCEDSSELRYRLHIALAFAYYQKCDIPKTVSELARARRHVTTDFDLARILQLAVWAMVCAGKLDKAKQRAHRALKILGIRTPSTRAETLWNTVKLFTACHVFPDRSFHAKSEQERRRARLCFDIWTRISSFSFDVDPVEYVHAVTQQYLAALRCVDSRRVCVARILLSHFGTLVPGFRQIERRKLNLLFQKLEEISDIFLSAVGYLWAINPMATLGDWKRADDLTERLLETIDGVDVDAQMGLAFTIIRRVYCVTRSVEEERAQVELEFREARRTNDLRSMYWSLEGQAHCLAMRGDWPGAMDILTSSQKALDRKSSKLTQASWIRTRGIALLQASDYAAARNQLEIAERMIRENRLWVFFSLDTAAYIAQAQIGPNWIANDSPSLQRSADLRRLTRRLKHWYRWSPAFRFFTARMIGRAYVARGKRREGIRWLDRAVVGARQSGAVRHLALALLDRSAVADDQKSAAFREGIDLMREMGTTVPHAERYLVGSDMTDLVAAPGENSSAFGIDI